MLGSSDCDGRNSQRVFREKVFFFFIGADEDFSESEAKSKGVQSARFLSPPRCNPTVSDACLSAALKVGGCKRQ
jgi:hypothetical protein